MKEKCLMENEKGSAIVLAVIILALLTLLGISVTRTSGIEVQIAGNDLRTKLAFYSAEAAKAYVIQSPDIYGSENITPGTPHFFPNSTDPYVPDTSGLPTPQSLSSSQSFNGNVEYASSGDPPRGSGYEAGEFQAHIYKMNCNGFSPSNTSRQVEIGFYRIGF